MSENLQENKLTSREHGGGRQSNNSLKNNNFS